MITRSWVWLLAIPISCDDSGQVVHTHTHVCASVIKWYNLVLAKGGAVWWKVMAAYGSVCDQGTCRLTAYRLRSAAPTLISSMVLPSHICYTATPLFLYNKWALYGYFRVSHVPQCVGAAAAWYVTGHVHWFPATIVNTLKERIIISRYNHHHCPLDLTPSDLVPFVSVLCRVAQLL